MLEQSFLLDSDQPKETKAGDNMVVAQIPSARNTIAAITRQTKKQDDETIERNSQYSMDEDEYKNAKKSGSISRQTSMNEIDELSNYEYFRFDQQHQLDDLVAKVKAKPNKKQAMSA